MADEASEFQWVNTLARIALLATLAILAAVLVAATALGVMTILSGEASWPAWTLHALVIAGVLLAALWVPVVCGLVGVMLANVRAVTRMSDRLDRAETLLSDQAESTRKLTDLACLSDQAKSLVYRDREIEAFREAVHEQLVHQDYKAAEVTIEKVKTRLGYEKEANSLLQDLEISRKATVEEKIDLAIGRIQQLINRHDWTRAIRESHRILRLFPENPKVVALPERIEKARNDHKRSLLQAYDEAVQKNDIDRGISLLKELDLYLSPQEAAALAEESARGVFKARLHNLGVQFAMRITDQLWADAIATGEEIIREYPNSRMAAEVRSKMEQLRGRAAAEATQPQRPATPQAPPHA